MDRKTLDGAVSQISKPQITQEANQLHTDGCAPEKKAKPDKKKSYAQIIMLVLIGCILIPPLLFTNITPGAQSETDNRVLVDFPRKGFAPNFENYLSDRIGFRDEALEAYAWINDRLFGFLTHPLYEYGADGWIYFRFDDQLYDEDFIRDYAAFVLQMQNYCKERGVDFLYLISPEKIRSYPEHYPKGVKFFPNTAASLKAAFDELGVVYLDQEEALEQRKAEGYQVFNRRYDAGHWNSEGMYAGSSALVARLQEAGYQIPDIDLDDYYKEEKLQRFLPVGRTPVSEWVYTYRHKDERGVGHEELQSYADELLLDERFSTRNYFVNTHLSEAPAVLMFQGSYYNTQGTMLQHQFSRLAQVHDYQNIFNLPYYLDVVKPDLVIFENADYTVTPNYYDADKIRWLQFPSALPAHLPTNARVMPYEFVVQADNTSYIQNIFFDEEEISKSMGSQGFDPSYLEGAWVVPDKPAGLRRYKSLRMLDSYELDRYEEGRLLWGVDSQRLRTQLFSQHIFKGSAPQLEESMLYGIVDPDAQALSKTRRLSSARRFSLVLYYKQRYYIFPLRIEGLKPLQDRLDLDE